MKSLLFVGCLLLVADMIRGNQKVAEAFREQIEACAAEQDIPAEELSKFDNFELEGEEKKKFGCLKLCVMKRSELIDRDNINAEKYEQMAEKIFEGDAERVAESVQNMLTCVEEAKEISDECEAAFEFSRCIVQKQKN
ncbi:uncharacterized protein LOC100881885 [Megachile rotundata]|uniref:uncharacterized protein LOC100881885 n=1 Tax=Megachile rotundata TaxID=143995 RepID=UPI000258D642|nr:PREDICTED: pheromone-binding protein Gp-9-like [Megachile rotundata]